MRIFCAGTEGLPDPAESAPLLFELSEERRERALRAVTLRARKTALASGLLLGRVLALYGRSERELGYGQHGKPLCDGLWLSLSHSGERVALAVSEQESVGCDLERVRAVPERASRAFLPAERELLGRLSGRERERAFFRLWTAKESILKRTGEGLRGLRSAGVLGANGELLAGCRLGTYESGDYVLSVCTEGEDFPHEIAFWEFLPEGDHFSVRKRLSEVAFSEWV